MNDAELLQAYVRSRDQRAFAELVARYVDLVYAAARRQCHGNAHLAQDVTQAVFVVLARKASRVRAAVLAGWLIKTARLAAKNALRHEMRRQQRERMAAMNRERNEVDHHAADAIPLDDALASLGQSDRTAVTLHYLQGKSQLEVGQTLGISEAAAAKRVSRAVAKLRSYFARHGQDVTPAALIALMTREAAVRTPAQVASAVSQAAAGAASPAAAAIAQQVVAAGIAKMIAGTVAAAALIAVTAGTMVKLLPPTVATISPSLPAAAQLNAAAPRSNVGPIKVGVCLSRFSATGPSWLGRPYGYGWQTPILAEFAGSSGISIRPLIEPASQDDSDFARQLALNFGATRAIDVTSASELRKLDVIVCNGIMNTSPQALDAIEAAVKDGTGLFVRMGLGTVTPEQTPQVNRLLLLKEGQYAFAGRLVDCEIVAAHPLLGGLSGKKGQLIRLTPNGPHGVLAGGAVALITVRSMTDVRSVGSNLQQRDDFVFHPLYAGEYGKGRVVVCAMPGWTAAPRELQKATGNQFVARCVRWAARREVQ